MTKIFRPDVDNVRYPLLLRNEQARRILDGLNFRSMSDDWTPIEFEFYVDDRKGGSCPDITFIVPCLAIRAELKNSIFPLKSDDLEFLPIDVAGEDWLLVNCLRTTDSYDEAKSLLHRDQTGRIFLVQKLHVTAPLPENSELFTLDESNRAYTYLLQSRVDRIKNLGLTGLAFKEIGQIAT